jgi:hypothetical protein
LPVARHADVEVHPDPEAELGLFHAVGQKADLFVEAERVRVRADADPRDAVHATECDDVGDECASDALTHPVRIDKEVHQLDGLVHGERRHESDRVVCGIGRYTNAAVGERGGVEVEGARILLEELPVVPVRQRCTTKHLADLRQVANPSIPQGDVRCQRKLLFTVPARRGDLKTKGPEAFRSLGEGSVSLPLVSIGEVVMFAVVATVDVENPGRARASLETDRVALVRRAPGFVAAYWLEPIDGIGMSVIVFATRADAEGAAAYPVPPIAGVSLRTLEVREVYAHA